MPRAVQAYPRNAVLNHNPMQNMLFDPTSIAKQGASVMELPSVEQMLEEVANGLISMLGTVTDELLTDVVNAVLTAIDSVTGLNLVGVSSLFDDILQWIDSAGAALSQGWLNFQTLINAVVGTVDADINDLIKALTDTSTDAATALSNWTTVLEDLGLDFPGFAQLLADITVWVNQVAASMQANWLNFQQLVNGIVGTVDADVTDLVAALTASGDAFTTLLSSIWSAIQTGGSWATVMAALEAAWATFATTITGLTSGEIATLEQMFDAVFGISSTSLTSLTDLWNASAQLVTDILAGASSATLETDWTAIVTALGVTPSLSLTPIWDWLSSMISTGQDYLTGLWNASGELIADILSGAPAATIEADWTALVTALGVAPSGTLKSTANTLFSTFAFEIPTSSVTGVTEIVLPGPRGRGALTATAKTTKAFISVGLSGSGSTLPRPGSRDIQLWETFNSIIGVVTHIYPDVFNKGTLTATAVNNKFIFPASLSGKGALTVRVQEWQTFQSIVGVVLHVYSTPQGQGVLSTTTKATKFTFPSGISGQGRLVAIVQDWQTVSGNTVDYGLYPTEAGRGVLSATAKATKFTFPDTISGQGRLVATVQDWQTFGSITGVVHHIYLDLFGSGVPSATTTVKQFSLTSHPAGRGVLTVKVPDITTSSFVMGTKAGVYALPVGRGSLAASGHSSKFLLPGQPSGKGVLTASSLTEHGIPSLDSNWGGTISGLLISGATAIENAIEDALTGNISGSLVQIQAAFNDLMALLGFPTGLGTGIPVASPPSSTPLFGNILDVSVSTVVDDIFGGSTGWADLLSLLFPTDGGSVGAAVTATAVAPVLGGGSLGDDVQAILDYIANALGHAGTGHSLTQIETYLGLIPSGNVPDLVTHFSNLISHILGGSGTTITGAASAVQSLASTLQGNSHAIQQLQNSLQQTGGLGGAVMGVDFTTYPDGAFPSIFSLTSTGSGSGFLEISGGTATWVEVANGDKSIFALYNGNGSLGNVNAITQTDYQLLSATMAGIPGFGSGTSGSNIGVLRSNTSKTTYVYAKAYVSSSWAFQCELGCFVGGVQHVFTTAPGTWNFNLSFAAGIGGNPYRFQVTTGTTVIIDYTDSSHISQFGSTFRSWGFISATGDSGQNIPAPATWVGCSDNAPAAVSGTGLQVCRKSTSGVLMAGTGNNFKITSSFWDSPLNETATVTWNPSTGIATVLKAGWFYVKLAVALSGTPTGAITPLIWQQGVVVGGTQGDFFNGAGGYMSNFSDVWLLYCDAGDTLQPGYFSSTVAATMVGTSDGTDTVFGVALLNPG